MAREMDVEMTMGREASEEEVPIMMLGEGSEGPAALRWRAVLGAAAVLLCAGIALVGTVTAPGPTPEAPKALGVSDVGEETELWKTKSLLAAVHNYCGGCYWPYGCVPLNNDPDNDVKDFCKKMFETGDLVSSYASRMTLSKGKWDRFRKMTKDASEKIYHGVLGKVGQKQEKKLSDEQADLQKHSDKALTQIKNAIDNVMKTCRDAQHDLKKTCDDFTGQLADLFEAYQRGVTQKDDTYKFEKLAKKGGKIFKGDDVNDKHAKKYGGKVKKLAKKAMKRLRP